MTGSLIDNEQGGFRAGKGCIDQIFTLKRISEKVQKKKHGMYVGFIDLEKAYDRQVLRIYYVGDKLLNRIKSMYLIVHLLSE